MLLFKKKFLDAIRSGQKTQTVRLWKWRKMKPGQRSYIPGAGYIQIATVDEVALDQSDRRRRRSRRLRIRRRIAARNPAALS